MEKGSFAITPNQKIDPANAKLKPIIIRQSVNARTSIGKDMTKDSMVFTPNFTKICPKMCIRDRL